MKNSNSINSNCPKTSSFSHSSISPQLSHTLLQIIPQITQLTTKRRYSSFQANSHFNLHKKAAKNNFIIQCTRVYEVKRASIWVTAFVGIN